MGLSTGGGYESFQCGQDVQVGPVVASAPIMITEISWAPEKYNAVWGRSIVRVAGEKGFGANFKYIADNSGNVSWFFFTTESHGLAAFKDIPDTSGNYTSLNNPEACPWAMYYWFKEYADSVVVNDAPVRSELMGRKGILNLLMGGVNYPKVYAVYSDGSTRMVTAEADISSPSPSVLAMEWTGKLVGAVPGSVTVIVSYQHPVVGASGILTLTVTILHPFSLTKEALDPSIWEKGSFGEGTRTLITGQYGSGDWQFSSGLNLSAYCTITVELGNDNMSGASFRIFDRNNYWTDPATYDFGPSHKATIDLQNMKNKNGTKIDPSHLYIAGFWSTGNELIIVSRVNLERYPVTMIDKPLFLIISRQKLIWKTKYVAKEGAPLKDILDISDCWPVLASVQVSNGNNLPSLVFLKKLKILQYGIVCLCLFSLTLFYVFWY